MSTYFDLAFTPSVLELQEIKGSRQGYEKARQKGVGRDRLLQNEIDHIKNRDSLYLASVSETGWPYLQHRGGDVGFIKILDDTTIGWLERHGNRQYLSTGNINADGKVALILMDYPNRTRLKLFGQATYHREAPQELLDAHGEAEARNDGAITIQILSFNWNCPKYITPRFTAEAVREMARPLQERIAELETQLAAAKSL